VELVKPRIHGSLGFLVLFALSACKPQESTPTPAPAGRPTGAIASPTAPSSDAPPPAQPAATPPASARESSDTWLVVGKGGVELGVIELRMGKPPSLAVEIESPDTAALKTKLEGIGSSNGLPLDMHLPTPSGTGRGPYGTRIIKYDDPLYRHAMKQELEPAFSVKEVLQLDDPLPPEGLKRVTVSRSGEKVGSIDFASTPPKLTVDTDKSDGMSLKSTWEYIQPLGELKVRYHTLKDAKETLVTVRAKPGDASYPEAVVLYMMVEKYYRARYAYKLEFSR
jgi:hypothetical protein